MFFGDLGKESANLISYLEQYEATPRIQPGENPATWMLTTIGAGSASPGAKPFDFAGSYQVSAIHNSTLRRIEEMSGEATEQGNISFPSNFATTTSTQVREVMARARTIFWRSPSYNTVRIITAAVLSLLIGSVYASSRTPVDESDMNSRVSTFSIHVKKSPIDALVSFGCFLCSCFYRLQQYLFRSSSWGSTL